MLMQGGGGGLPDLKKKISESKFLLYGIFVYSDLDQNFIEFLKNTHGSLSDMSGKDTFLFWWEYFDRDAELLLWEPSKAPPIDKNRNYRRDAIRLAKAFDIPMSNTPCLMFCENLSDKRALVYSLDNNWPHNHMAEHFRQIFDIVEECVREKKNKPTLDIYEYLEPKFNKIKIKKWISRTVSNESIGTVLQAIATGVALA